MPCSAVSARSSVWIVIFAVSVSSWSASGSAQTTSANIQGTVSDNTGGLPGASVIARDQASGFTFEATTDTQGVFTLKGLRPGTYQITASLGNFKPQSKTVQVLLGQNVTVDFALTDVAFTGNGPGRGADEQAD